MEKKFTEATKERTIRVGDSVSIPTGVEEYLLQKQVSGLTEDQVFKTPKGIEWNVSKENGRFVIRATTGIKVKISAKLNGTEVQHIANEICAGLFKSELFQSVKSVELVYFSGMGVGASEKFEEACKIIYGEAARKAEKQIWQYWLPSSCCKGMGKTCFGCGNVPDSVILTLQPIAVLKDNIVVENYGEGEYLGERGCPWILSDLS